MNTILVIEDDDALRLVLLEWLNLEGFESLGAHDGIMGIEYAQQHLPDLIICDVLIPELSGFELITELRTGPHTADIPVIFLTAQANEEDRKLGRELGAVDYITKPFAFADLLSAINIQLDP